MKTMTDEKRKRLGIKCPAELVERLDEIKWERRVPRYQIVERIIRVGVELWETEVDGDRSKFEQLESEVFGTTDCSFDGKKGS